MSFAQALLPFLLSQQEGDVCVVDNDVGDEGTRTAFSATEEEVGSDGGDCGSQEKLLGFPVVSVDCGEEPFGQV